MQLICSEDQAAVQVIATYLQNLPATPCNSAQERAVNEGRESSHRKSESDGWQLENSIGETLDLKFTEAGLKTIGEKIGTTWADRFGICLSALCVVHCMLTPFLLIALPSLQLLKFHESFHAVLLFVLPLLAVLAFIPGYRRHRDKRVFYWVMPGLVLIVSAYFMHTSIWVETVLSIAGSLFLIRSHVLNRHLCACCNTGHDLRRLVNKSNLRLMLRGAPAKSAKSQRLLTPPLRR